MEGNFKRKQISCMQNPLQQVQHGEQTLEIRLPEGMPDVGQVLMAWGQPIARSKEWREESLHFSGGMMVWVLYLPEDGSQEQCLEGWIPFQMRWELPENTPEGILRLRCLPRFVDGRSTSPRKILVRAGMSVLAEAFVPMKLETAVPENMPEDVALLENTYPLRVAREAGEKTFRMEEELTLPDSVPKVENLVSWRMEPKITDKKVLGDKAVFRGNGNLRLLYRSPEGQVHSWDFELPFSQYTDLQGEYGADARVDIALLPTALELEALDGMLNLKSGMAAQYRITEQQPVTLVEDAYSPSRELGITVEDLTPPVILENRQENLYGEQTIAASANVIADAQFLPDFPRQKRTENGVQLEYPGQFQVLYYGEDGRLHGSSARWEGSQTLPAGDNSRILAVPMGGAVQAAAGNGQIQMKAELPVELTAAAEQSIPMVTGLELMQPKQPDPGRPSLILRRAGERSLWELAKASGSTMDAIRRANNLSGEPARDQMLLIPVI